MKAGFSRVCVNPMLGEPLEGLSQKGGCTEIHDDLYLSGLWLNDGEMDVLIIGCDLLFFERKEIDRFKGALGRRFNLLPKQILFNTSHNHAGPRLTRWAYSEGADPLYLDLIEQAVLTVGEECRKRLQTVTVHAGMTESNVPMSRRRINEQGNCEWAPSSDGPTCKSLPVTLFRGESGAVLSIIFSVSCHPSTWYENSITADFPGVAQRLLNEHYNTDGALFLQGCGGDAKARQIGKGDSFSRDLGFAPIEEAGKEIAEAVIKLDKEGLVEITPELKCVYADMFWPLQQAPGREELEIIAAGGPTIGVQANRCSAPWAKDMLARLKRFGSLPTAVPVGLHSIQIGKGLRLIGMEGEAVGEWGNFLIGLYHEGVTFPLSYTNGAQLYLPVSRMHNEQGYEVNSFAEYHWPAELKPGEEAIVENQIRQWQAAGF